MVQGSDDQKLEQSKVKNNLNLFGGVDSESVNFNKYSFVTSALLISLIYFIFTFLFILITGIIGIMISYFLQRYNLINRVIDFQLWQKILIFGGIVFFVANFCIFEAEAIVAKLIKSKGQSEKNNDLRSVLKIRPKNWQKIFYSIILTSFSLLIGYLFVINYISWNYNQFWN